MPRECSNQGCTKRPSFGIEGSKRRDFSAQHAKEGMLNIVGKRCGNQGCMTTWPSYGMEGSKRPEFCAQHAKQGMIDVSSKKCANQGCTEWPSYGTEGSKTREFCAQHATQGMINLNQKICANQRCSKHPSFGVEGSKVREFCAQHAKQGMINVRSGKRVAASIMETSFTGTDSKRTSNKRGRRDGNPVVLDSAQTGSTRTRIFEHESSVCLGLTATPDVASLILEHDCWAARKSTTSTAEAATSRGAIEPLFSPESGVTVKVE